MVKFLRDLILGEPVIFAGLTSTALTTWTATLVAMGEPVPIFLAVATPVWVAVTSFYTRSKVTPV